MTGGELRFPKETMTGDFALNNQRVKANKAFLGCNGFDKRSWHEYGNSSGSNHQ